MKYRCYGAARWAALGFLLILSFLGFPRAFAQSSNGVLREVYTGIGGGAVSDLTSHPSFPCCPSLETIQPTFEAPTEFAENYGQRMRALVIAPQTGSYTFWVASDDGGALFLSTTESPAQRVQIASVNSWTSSREWTKEPNQQSATNIALVAGQRYYMEALQKEGGGGDNLAVRWRLPSGLIEAPIPNNRVLVYGLGPPVVAVQPTSVTVVEGGSATFTVQLQRKIGSIFQWKRNGTNIPNATNTSYTLGPLVLADSPSSFFCSVTNSLGGTNSTSASLTVVADTTPPTINTVGNLGDNTIVFLIFSEPLEVTSATTTAHYSISGGVTVTRASFGVDARTIILTTTPMAANVTYTLTVNDLRDRATVPNTIVPNTQRTFAVTSRPLDISLLSLPKEPLGPTTRRHGVVLSEVMYHPTNRTDGRNLEYIEIYNSQPWFEELGGWRITGAIDYVFPSNTVLQSRSFLVVAADPADFRSVYTVTPVFGPFLGSNSLQNSSGSLRLRNERDAVVFEMNYSGEPPYPVAADGAGHSLVLARASYGERDPRAWVASDQVGGSPGAVDIFNVNAFRTIVINEFLAHTDPPDVDYIELYNYGNSSVNIAGCILTDDPTTNKFLVPSNTMVSPRGFIAFTEEQLGFSLSAAGETILLKHPSGRTVLDGVRFSAQENGVATGRYPDGAARFTRLAAPTLGANNAPFKAARVVINEIMYDPVSGDADDEYIELRNCHTNAVDVSGWRLRDAVSFNIPTNTFIPLGGYLVIAKHAAHLRTNYAGLTTANTLGDYSGTLANGGERIELNMPDEQVSTNALGQLKTNLIHITVDEVAYGPGGQWGQHAHGGGSSLELRDVRTDRRLAPNWAESDESAKSPWVNVEATGTMDNGYADANQLHITLLGVGEALIDNVEVIRAGSNVIGDGTFESGTAGWVFQGNHNQTSWEPGEGFGSQRSLHLRATGRGDTGANRVRTQLSSTLSAGSVVTLRARVRWLKGNPNILLRLRGNWMEAPGYTLTARNLGTPGAVNSRAVTNIGPAITDVLHWPPLPAASQQVLVTARVQDPDGLAYLAVNYRIDPSTNYLALAMTNNGAGVFSAVLPGQVGGTRAAFFIQASDSVSPPASSAFPNDAPAHECLVQWGDTTIPGTLPTYRFWISQTNVNRWAGEEKMSNNPKDTTFVYGTNRIIYNAGAWFHGSPYHSPGYDSPVGVSCDYDLAFPEDNRLLGETDINLFRPGNGGGDGSGQAEIHGNWFGRQFGAPFLYHRPVFVFVNGQRRETIFHDAQQPNGDFVDQWYPDDTDGDLHKIQIGFEFGDLAYGASEPGFAGAGANLANYITTGGVKKQARYRQTWPRRSATPLELNDYTNIFMLVNTVLTNAAIGSATYTSALTNAVDVEEWFKVHVTQHLYNNGDSFSYGGGQNAFAYKPERDNWKLFLWDIDFAFGGSPTDGNLTGIGGADHGPRNDHPPFRRIYWQALIEAANGMLNTTRSNPILDSRYNGMVAGGAGVANPQGIKDFIAARRAFILSQISANQSTFAITSNGGADFSTNRDVAVLTGTAPLEVRTILVNGIAYPTTWTAFNTWQVRVPLASGTNTIQLTGIDPKGALVAGVARTIRVNYTGTTESPQGRVVINEIMYNPVVPGAAFLEIYNTSTFNSFDLSRWRLEGVDFTFADGTIIGPGSYVVLAKDTAAYALAYGSLAPVIATFGGTLRNEGETLKLIKPGALSAPDEVIDEVAYEPSLPWPLAANGLGPSLQLIDAAQDNARAANWGVSFLGNKATPGSANSVRSTVPPFPQVWLNEVMPDDSFSSTNNVPDGFGDRDPWVELYNGGTDAISLAGWFLANNFTNLAPWPFPASALIGPKEFLVVWLDGEPGESSPAELHASFRAAPALGSVALVKGTNALIDHLNYSLPTSSRSYGSFPDGNASGRRVFSVVTPGATNHPASAPLTVFINEWMADNLSTLPDPEDGNYEDWFEMFNPGSNIVDLGGYFFTDELTNPFKYLIPAGTLIPGGGYLLVWADGETFQNGPYPQDLHVNFSLAKLGEAIGLFAPDGTLIDAVTFGLQTSDVSQGRFPDGAATITNFANATPREANALVLLNGPPLLNPIGNQTVNEGSTLSFTATATDTNVPGQSLTFSFVGPVPSGATLNPSSGIFIWTPGEVQGPGKFTVTIRVTDSASSPLSDEETFTIFVHEVNSAPELSFPTEWTIIADLPFSLDTAGTDADLPMQMLVYALEPGAPSGAAIDATSGQFSWTPPGQGPGTNQITVRVTDNGVPAASATRTLEIVVRSGLRADMARNGAQVFIFFPTTPGRTYRVFYKDNLGDAGWTQLGSDTLADRPTLTFPDDLAASPQRFYRVEKVD